MQYESVQVVESEEDAHLEDFGEYMKLSGQESEEIGFFKIRTTLLSFFVQSFSLNGVH